jgi:membrane protein insertase Oxa1/YidC/SpoIIIJ
LLADPFLTLKGFSMSSKYIYIIFFIALGVLDFYNLKKQRQTIKKQDTNNTRIMYLVYLFLFVIAVLGLLASLIFVK